LRDVIVSITRCSNKTDLYELEYKKENIEYWIEYVKEKGGSLYVNEKVFELWGADYSDNIWSRFYK
jgi:hypothetical protein